MNMKIIGFILCAIAGGLVVFAVSVGSSVLGVTAVVLGEIGQYLSLQ